MSFYTIQAQGYFIQYSDILGRTSKKRHEFCGSHTIESASCPNCQKPLLRLLLIDLNDTRVCIENTQLKTLSLFFCWTCNLAQEFFFYHMIDDSTIHIVHYGKGGVETDFPYPSYPLYFPGQPAILEAIPEAAQQIISLLNNEQIDEYDVKEHDPLLCQPHHQLGGEPYLLQREAEIMQCPECGKRMPFLASIGDDCLEPRGFTGNKDVQVLYFYCSSCAIIGAYQECD